MQSSSTSSRLNPAKINVKKDEMFVLPTRVIDWKQINDEEDLSDVSSSDELINDINMDNDQFIEKLTRQCSVFDYDLDGRQKPLDLLFDNPADAANFSPYHIIREPMEVESIVLWDYFGGNTFSDLNVIAGDTVYVVAEEYQYRCLNSESYVRLPFQYSLARWISGRQVDPYLGIIPAHYVIPKKFYHENPLLFKYPLWFHGNNDVEEVVRILFADRSALCPGLFAIFSPPWLNPDPRDLRCYFLIMLVERSKEHNQMILDCLEMENKKIGHLTDFLNRKILNAIKKPVENAENNVRSAIDFLCELHATPYSPMLLTITRSELGHFEFMSRRYLTLYDLVYYLSTHRSPLPTRLVFNRMSPDVVNLKFVPPPTKTFKKSMKAQIMTIEQWAAQHFEEISHNFEIREKMEFVTKSVFDLGKKTHERFLKKFDVTTDEYTKIVESMSGFEKAAEKQIKKGGGAKKEKSHNDKNQPKKDLKPWTELPQHETSIYINSPFYINMDRIRCNRIALGSGAFGSVEVGKFEIAPKKWQNVAVKKLKMLPNSKDERDACFGEIEILIALSHPNIVLFHGFCLDKDSQLMYLVFELMETALDKYVEKTSCRMSENERLDILSQICRGMSYLHTRSPSIIHGDLAARNILLKKHPINSKKQMIAKITDFGLAKICRDELYTNYSDPNKIPFKWLPPEVLGPRILSTKSDIWSFGMICFEIYGIGEPYGILPAAKVLQFLNDGYRFEKLPGMSPCIFELAMECWRKQPADRPSFSELEERFIDYIIEEDEEDELISVTREKELLDQWKQQTRKAKVNKIIEAHPDL
ncbi:unnamed protein product [Caenorhabditis angaria]|uniref:Protein kinase domain-containing protein n=1 Tax=Caenorhabditis angaria TaxID=860376 RepID=A0A9P1IGV6_9PELO|nr:unnamed protein product [Caenorhabditis angaria]